MRLRHFGDDRTPFLCRFIFGSYSKNAQTTRYSFSFHADELSLLRYFLNAAIKIMICVVTMTVSGFITFFSSVSIDKNQFRKIKKKKKNNHRQQAAKHKTPGFCHFAETETAK